MAKAINFNNVKKQYLTVTLNDDDNTTIMIGTPTKEIMGELMVLQGSVEGVQEDNDPETMENLYGACARLMSRNKTKTIITKEKLDKIFDLEDIIIFFNAYMDFMSEVAKTKN